MVSRKATHWGHPDRNLIALGIRQPWAELILRGIKMIEVRSVDTRVRGPVYLYASKKVADTAAARKAAAGHDLDLEALPRGLLVGTVTIRETAPARARDAAAACIPQKLLAGRFAWHLENPQRLDEPLTVRFLPYGVWFYPFKRRNDRSRRKS